MHIDITKLKTQLVTSLNICGEVHIPKNYLENSLIDDLKDIKVKGKLTYDEEYQLVLTAELSGTMVLKDDMTLEPVDYNFKTDIEEILDKAQNTLDITDILWQNILVEIPSKVRSTDEDIELNGDGWRVISEEKFNEIRSKANNPFSNLDEILKTKEER